VTGHISINSLYAERIEVLRRPCCRNRLPRSRRRAVFPFLADLPVAMTVASLRAQQVLLEESFFGLASVVSLEGHLSLSEGTFDRDLISTGLMAQAVHSGSLPAIQIKSSCLILILNCLNRPMCCQIF